MTGGKNLMASWAARIGAAIGQCDKGQLMCTWNKQRHLLEELSATQLQVGVPTHSRGSTLRYPGQVNKVPLLPSLWFCCCLCTMSTAYFVCTQRSTKGKGGTSLIHRLLLIIYYHIIGQISFSKKPMRFKWKSNQSRSIEAHYVLGHCEWWKDD